MGDVLNQPCGGDFIFSEAVNGARFVYGDKFRMRVRDSDGVVKINDEMTVGRNFV